MNLYCLPYAGATASFYKRWEPRFEAQMRVHPVELPGRGRKFGQKPIGGMEMLIEHIFDELKDRLASDDVYGLFGHSLGGMLAYRLAAKAGQAGLPPPKHLFISGVLPPHVPRPFIIDHELPDRELLDVLVGLGGISSEVLAHPELLSLLLPVIRADLRVYNEGFSLRASEPPDAVHCDMTVCYGKCDPLTDGDIMSWSRYTTRQCLLEPFKGGHFFLHEEEEHLIRTIEAGFLSNHSLR